MKLKRILIFIVLMTSIASCSNNKKSINIKFQSIDGLKEESQVLISGVHIGEVESIELEDNLIIVKISIEKDIELPIDSRFKIFELDILGNKAIEIKLGMDVEKLENDAIVEGLIEESNLIFEDPDKIIERFLNPDNKQDSILLELKRLNQNIEKLIEKEK